MSNIQIPAFHADSWQHPVEGMREINKLKDLIITQVQFKQFGAVIEVAFISIDWEDSGASLDESYSTQYTGYIYKKPIC